jgi:hypothetical protein
VAVNTARTLLDELANMQDRITGVERVATARAAGRAEGRIASAKVENTLNRLALRWISRTRASWLNSLTSNASNARRGSQIGLDGAIHGPECDDAIAAP